MNSSNTRVKFLALWAILQAAKLALAMSLPLLVDEAFYAWEGRFPALAYSDLPGLTAALTRIGTQIGGQHVLALRAPFLLLGAAIPWLVLRISRRWFGAEAGYLAGLLSLLMPLSGLLGVLALPDVPLVFAALLCLDSLARLLQRVDWPALLCLAVALVIGALAHYRFALVLVAGLVGLLCDVRGRALLREPRLWLVLLTGALAWWPLLDWNIAHAGAGLRFQFLDRNPWQFRAGAAIWIPIQLLVVTPALFVLLLATLRTAWQRRKDHAGAPWAMIAGIADVSVLGYFALGFFADRQRVSFHWPLAGWLVLLTAAPVTWQCWSAGARRAVLGIAGLGLLCALIFLGAASRPQSRNLLAASRFYPADFAGWQELANLARSSLLPAPGIFLAGNFAVAAELSHALNRRDIVVLDDPENHKHGRAAQL
ncbi:MAG: glycosyltransferase family 39 protein, partial [Arenimonas sp.]